jgi:hypothetical protein
MFSDLKSMAQAIVKIQAGRELGLPPVYSMQNINMIRDRLTTSANTMAMLVKRGEKYNYRIKEHTDAICSIEFYEDGKPVGVSTFTIEDAKRADLVKPNSGWAKYPRAMLFSRAISQGARIYCPDAIGGVYTEEEMQSIPPTTITFPRPAAITSDNATKTGIGEEVGSLPAEPEPSAVTAESHEAAADPIDLGWLKESLAKVKWKNAEVVSWLGSKTECKGLILTGSLSDIVKRMNPAQAAVLSGEIDDRLLMSK